MSDRITDDPEFTPPPRVSTGASITTVVARWAGGKRYEIGRASGGPTVTIDTEAGPGPVDTLLGALAACSAMDVEAYLAKRRTPVETLEVVVEGERRAQAPRRLTAALLEFRVGGASIEPEHAERAVRLAVEQYCSVATSLAGDVVLSTRVVLNGRALGPARRAQLVEARA